MFDNIIDIEEMRSGYDLNDGYTRVVNRILDDLSAADLNGAELKIVLYVIRNTYGRKGKKAAVFTVQNIADATGLHYNTASRTLRGLIKKNVLIRDEQRGPIGYQKYADRWGMNSTKMTNSAKTKFNQNDELNSTKMANSRDLLLYKYLNKEKETRGGARTSNFKKNKDQKKYCAAASLERQIRERQMRGKKHEF